jgi:hypothetical protein
VPHFYVRLINIATMTQDEFISAIHSRKHTLPQLRRKLEALPASERFSVLIRIFADASRPKDSFGDQEYAGRLLVDLRPSPRQSLDEIIRMVLPTWNVSVEQLPKFLADTFGTDELTRISSRLMSDYPTDSREHRSLDTMRWWVRGS